MLRAKNRFFLVLLCFSDRYVMYLYTAHGSDFAAAMDVCINLRETFEAIGVKERYSGETAAILKAVVGDERGKIRPTSAMLHVNKDALQKAKMQKRTWLIAGEYSSLVVKVQLRNSRKPADFPQQIMDWLMENTRPSSNSKNIIKYKDDNKQPQQHIVQWREKSIRAMFTKCKMDIQQGDLLKRTYFYNAIPPFIKMVKPMEALCPYHMAARKWTCQLENNREKWHVLKDGFLVCKCTCLFCSREGCNHGKNPDEGRCATLTCKRCIEVKCPVEWTDKAPKTTWYTSSLKKRLGGGNAWVDKEHNETRLNMMSKWETDMKAFAKHDGRATWMKSKVDWLKHNLPQGHVLIKADFIQNISHSRGQETDAAYYNKRQTQLLTFVVWYHEDNSTAEEPKISIKYYDYLSPFLKHTSLYFQKCFTHLMQYLKEDLPYEPEKVNSKEEQF